MTQWRRRRYCILMGLLLAGMMLGSPAAAQSVTLLAVNTSEPRVYEKFEMRFTIPQTAPYPFFAYDALPPPGVQAAAGLSVDALITRPSGDQVRQPAFYMTDVARTVEGGETHYNELSTGAWVVRFSPQERGIHQVSIAVTGTAGTAITPVTTFDAQPPERAGFIRVSEDDPRYFEFADSTLFWPVGPADGYGDYAVYKGTGINFDRPWLGGLGAYSTNWARWLSSAESLGNEGAMTRLNFREHAPGSELSYDLTYPDAFRYWITNWLNEDMGPQFKAYTTYQVRIRLKTVGLRGPRHPAYTWGVTARLHSWLGHQEALETVENTLRDQPLLFDHIQENRDWFTLETTFTTGGSPDNDVSLYLDNVSGGSAYIDEFLIREVLADGTLGGSVLRNPKADMHTYVDPRGAAKIDWLVEQAEANGVYLKLVVHDKNDWIQNHLLVDGSFADEGDGYYQPENTKARWLLRQWYRYLAARWGYSTAVHSWELNNEGPPDAESDGTAAHWETAQAFARYLHDIDSHPHLATTSFWCCWRPAFWGNSVRFPDIDYADLHEYTRDDPLGADMAAFHQAWSAEIAAEPVGKPVIRAETGINHDGWFEELQAPNPGIWYRHLLWASLDSAALFEPGYWYSEHLDVIPRLPIASAFAGFVARLDVQRGGYVDLAAQVTNDKLRVVGQKNSARHTAYGWIQNTDFTWRSAMDGYQGSQSGTINLTLAPNTVYRLTWVDTGSGQAQSQESLTAGADGMVSITVEALTEDVAFWIEAAD